MSVVIARFEVVVCLEEKDGCVGANYDSRCDDSACELVKCF